MSQFLTLENVACCLDKLTARVAALEAAAVVVEDPQDDTPVDDTPVDDTPVDDTPVDDTPPAYGTPPPTDESALQ